MTACRPFPLSITTSAQAVPHSGMKNTLAKARPWLDGVRAFPTISSTDVALNLSALLARYTRQTPSPLAPTETGSRDSWLDSFTSPRKITQVVGMTVITYLALGCLSALSLLINGAVGMGKIALSLVVVFSDRSAAQDFLEEGVFHLLVAAADFAVSYFHLVRGALAVASTVIPDATRATVGLVYQPWDGPIVHSPGATPEAIEENRKKYCYLRGVADMIQSLIIPDEGGSYLSSAWAALVGEPLAERKIEVATKS